MVFVFLHIVELYITYFLFQFIIIITIKLRYMCKKFISKFKCTKKILSQKYYLKNLDFKRDCDLSENLINIYFY